MHKSTCRVSYRPELRWSRSRWVIESPDAIHRSQANKWDSEQRDTISPHLELARRNGSETRSLEWQLEPALENRTRPVMSWNASFENRNPSWNKLERFFWTSDSSYSEIWTRFGKPSPNLLIALHPLWKAEPELYASFEKSKPKLFINVHFQKKKRIPSYL